MKTESLMNLKMVAPIIFSFNQHIDFAWFNIIQTKAFGVSRETVIHSSTQSVPLLLSFYWLWWFNFLVFFFSFIPLSRMLLTRINSFIITYIESLSVFSWKNTCYNWVIFVKKRKVLWSSVSEHIGFLISFSFFDLDAEIFNGVRIFWSLWSENLTCTRVRNCFYYR